MNSEKRDFLAWALLIGAAMSALSAAIISKNIGVTLLSCAIILLVIADRRRAKVLSVGLLRIVDERGDTRGLIGWDGEGVQLGLRTSPISNSAIAYPVLWQKEQSVAFSFKCAKSFTSAFGDPIEQRPAIGLCGEMDNQWRTYGVEFSYSEGKPDIWVSQSHDEGVLCHRFTIK
jgi:hypothetical protein